MPSARTSARLAPLAPSPRNDTPCDVGLAVWLPDRRSSEKPTTFRSLSSVARAPHCCNWFELTTTASGCASRLSITCRQNGSTGSSHLEALLKGSRNQGDRQIILSRLPRHCLGSETSSRDREGSTLSIDPIEEKTAVRLTNSAKLLPVDLENNLSMDDYCAGTVLYRSAHRLSQCGPRLCLGQQQQERDYACNSENRGTIQLCLVLVIIKDKYPLCTVFGVCLNTPARHIRSVCPRRLDSPEYVTIILPFATLFHPTRRRNDPVGRR